MALDLFKAIKLIRQGRDPFSRGKPMYAPLYRQRRLGRWGASRKGKNGRR